MEDLKQILCEEVRWYAGSGRGAGLQLFSILDDARQIYAVNAVDIPRTAYGSNIVVMARIEGAYIVIEEDRTDRPLVKHLMERGIPREKIILAFAGETVPEPVS